MKAGLAGVLDAIDGGEVDDYFADIYEAIKARQKLLAARKLRTFKAGDKVRFNRQTRPLYLVGALAVVNRVSTSRVHVTMLEGAGRFIEGVEVRTTAALLEQA